MTGWDDQFTVTILTIILSAIISFIVASFTSRMQLRNAAVLKAADFRQAWINELRDCLSQFQAVATSPTENPMHNTEFYRLGTKIELLMNPDDGKYECLHNLMYEYLTVANGDLDAKYRVNARFVSVSQKILKTEWDRLKKDIREGRV